MPDTKTLTQQAAVEDEPVQLTVRMPHELNVRIKQAVAPHRGMTLNQAALEGLEMWLERLEASKK